MPTDLAKTLRALLKSKGCRRNNGAPFSQAAGDAAARDDEGWSARGHLNQASGAGSPSSAPVSKVLASVCPPRPPRSTCIRDAWRKKKDACPLELLGALSNGGHMSKVSLHAHILAVEPRIRLTRSLIKQAICISAMRGTFKS